MEERVAGERSKIWGCTETERCGNRKIKNAVGRIQKDDFQKEEKMIRGRYQSQSNERET